MHDLLGINTEFQPRFLRQYLNLDVQINKAVQQYINDVKSRTSPMNLNNIKRGSRASGNSIRHEHIRYITWHK